MAKVNLVSPWDEYYHKMKAFFEEDDNVTILYDEGADDIKYIKVLVDNPEKAAALDVLLEKKKTFGNVTLIVIVVPTNSVMKDIERYMNQRADDLQYYGIYDSALLGNENFAFIKQVTGMLGFDAIFVVFRKKVIQYYNDDLGDLNGMKSTLAEDIARDIFVRYNGVFFNTDTNDIKQSDRDYKRRYYELTASPVQHQS